MRTGLTGFVPWAHRGRGWMRRVVEREWEFIYESSAFATTAATGILTARFNDMKKYSWQILPTLFVCGAVLASTASIKTLAADDYQIFVTNEKSGDLTIIDGADNKVLATIP